MYDYLLYKTEANIAIVTFNRPRVLNAMNAALREELSDTLNKANINEEIGAMIITGAGGNFSAGQDLHEILDFKGSETTDWIGQWGALYEDLRGFPKPLIAAIKGYCVGAAWQVVTLCDLRIASENTIFEMGEVDVGIPCITGSALLWPIIGKARTAEIILTGRKLTADEALNWGIVNEVLADDTLLERAKELARDLASKPSVAIRENKKWINMLTEDLHKRSVEYGPEAHGRAFESGQPQKLMTRFKRDE